jgi:hypothetical protein
MWRCLRLGMRRTTRRLLRRHTHLVQIHTEGAHLVSQGLHGTNKTFQDCEEGYYLRHSLRHILRRYLWRVDDEIATGQKGFPTETVLGVQDQAASMDSALEGTTIHPTEASRRSDSVRVWHAGLRVGET